MLMSNISVAIVTHLLIVWQPNGKNICQIFGRYMYSFDKYLIALFAVTSSRLYSFIVLQNFVMLGLLPCTVVSSTANISPSRL